MKKDPEDFEIIIKMLFPWLFKVINESLVDKSESNK